MRNILIISFSIIREGECNLSYALGSLLAYINKNKTSDMQITHWPFNINENNFESKLFNQIDSTDMGIFDRIAISDYIWSESYVKKIIPRIKKRKFNGIFILGGNQVTYSKPEELFNDYPNCQIFITGFGEVALLQSFTTTYKDRNLPIILKKSPLLQELPSPYLENILKIRKGQRMVRMETKRGCIYSCNFCAHRELNPNSAKIPKYPLERVFKELDLFKAKKCKKINIIDPIFNYGDNYLQILKYIKDIDLKSKISLQTKFELISGLKGKEFIDLCSEINVVLEFGLQTIFENECQAINRINKIQQVSKIINILNEKKIDYEIDLIYGLPNQTVDTLKKSIEFLQERNCENITLHPLMLLKGTQLYYDKLKWGLQEKKIEGSEFPVVVQSNSFTENEWKIMRTLADDINMKHYEKSI